MALTNTETSYGAVARILHWLTAALVLTLIPLGLIANELPSATDAELARKAATFSLHKTLGVLTFFTALLRILWTFTQRRPVPLHPDRRIETWAADAVHRALYIAIFLVPLSGWLHHSATDGFAPILWPFGQSLPLVPKSPRLAAFFATWHWLFTKVLIVAVILHVGGALKHAVVDRDFTLSRMTRGIAAGHPVPAGRTGSVLLAPALLWVAAIAAATALAMPRLPGGPPESAVGSGQTSEWTVESGTVAIEILQLGQPVGGEFGSWSASISFDPEAAGPVLGEVDVTIEIASLTLGSVTDQALSSDFLDAGAHPSAIFAAEIRADEGAYSAEGDLTLKGTTIPVTLPFTLALDGDTAEASGELTLDRRSFAIGTGYKDDRSLGFPVKVGIDLTATRS